MSSSHDIPSQGDSFLNPTQPLFKCVDYSHVVTAYDMEQLLCSQAPATTDENRDSHIISVPETKTQTNIHVSSSLILQQLQEQSESHQHRLADNDTMDYPTSDFSTQALGINLTTELNLVKQIVDEEGNAKKRKMIYEDVDESSSSVSTT